MDIGKKIESIFSAITFAEANEHQIAREFMGEGKRVLLACRPGFIRQKTIDYAVNVSSRINAALHLLVVGSGEFRIESVRKQAEENGVRLQMISTSGDLKERILDFTRSDSRTVFVIMDSSEAIVPEQSAGSRRSSSDWSRIGCPLVVVSDGSTI